MESEAPGFLLPQLYPINALQPLPGTPIILSFVEITATHTIVRTRSADYLDPLRTQIAIRIHDDLGGAYPWLQTIGGGGALADVRSDVFSGAPDPGARLLIVSVSNGNVDDAETLVELYSSRGSVESDQ